MRRVINEAALNRRFFGVDGGGGQGILLPRRAGRAAPPDAQPAGVLSPDFWGSYVVTMRPYLLFLSAITGIAGMSLAPAAPLPDPLLLSLAFFPSYLLRQAQAGRLRNDT